MEKKINLHLYLGFECTTQNTNALALAELPQLNGWPKEYSSESYLRYPFILFTFPTIEHSGSSLIWNRITINKIDGFKWQKQQESQANFINRSSFDLCDMVERKLQLTLIALTTFSSTRQRTFLMRCTTPFFTDLKRQSENKDILEKLVLDTVNDTKISPIPRDARERIDNDNRTRMENSINSICSSSFKIQYHAAGKLPTPPPPPPPPSPSPSSTAIEFLRSAPVVTAIIIVFALRLSHFEMWIKMIIKHLLNSCVAHGVENCLYPFPFSI
uniref:Uncharacterized protein n=1 Tax=Glossina austeni TaxID=7395 RepID=A0A1A9V5E1_GLOAU